MWKEWEQEGVFSVFRPNSVFEPHIQKWVIFVRRRPLTFQNVRQSF